MNAYELADTLKGFVKQIKPTNNESDDAVVKGLPNWFIEQLEQTSTMLCEQEDYIAELKENYTSACLEVRLLGRENIDLQDKIKALKAKTLTDEEIIEIAEKSRQWVNDPKNRLEGADCNLYGNAYNKHFARAILRKAQEK